MANVPSLGTPNHMHFEDEELNKTVKDNLKDLKSLNPATESIFCVDKSINNHPRFAGLAKSIRERRGEKVNI